MADQQIPLAPLQPSDPLQEPVAPLQEPVAVPPEQQDLLPSTEEAQQETLKAREMQDKFEQKRRELEALKGPHGTFPSDEEVLNALEAEEQDKLDQEQEAQNRSVAEQNALEAAIAKRQNLLQRASAQGIKLPRDEQIDTIIEQRANEDQADLVQQESDAQLQEMAKARVKSAITPEEAEVEAAASPIRAEIARTKAQEKVVQDELQKAQENEQRAREKVANAELNLKNINPNSYWDNASTGQKILAALSMAAGAYGSSITGAPNTAMTLIQSAIDRDLDAQKLNNENRLKKSMNALKVAELQLDQLASKTQNQLAQAKLAEIKQGMKLAQDEHRMKLTQLYQSQQAKNDFSSGNLKSTVGLSKEERERVVRLPDGSIGIADNKDAANDVRRFVNETGPGIRALTRLESMIEDPNFSRLSLEDRAAANTERRTLVGALRLSLVGPGALTEKEMELIKDTIGNPNKFILSSIEKEKLKTLKASLKDRVNYRYKNAGITPPPSKREKLIEFNMKRSGKSQQEVEKSINNLIRSGKLSKEFAQ